jgi:hypothetical protein
MMKLIKWISTILNNITGLYEKMSSFIDLLRVWGKSNGSIIIVLYEKIFEVLLIYWESEANLMVPSSLFYMRKCSKLYWFTEPEANLMVLSSLFYMRKCPKLYWYTAPDANLMVLSSLFYMRKYSKLYWFTKPDAHLMIIRAIINNFIISNQF